MRPNAIAKMLRLIKFDLREIQDLKTGKRAGKKFVKQ